MVLGAGCSMEEPTGLPSGAAASRELYRRLVADGVLVPGDVEDPSDLSAVADVVFAKKDSQGPLVERFLDTYNLKRAAANDGYQLVAAMLSEQVVASVVTLNFDLALIDALVSICSGSDVAVIEKPADLRHQKLINVYYLHRSANAENPDEWVLRTAALKSEWANTWQPIVANRVLTAPVVVFAGLGTPVSVLIESTKLLKSAVPDATVYQVDVMPVGSSRFAQELGIGDAAYIQSGWCDFMQALSARLLTEHKQQLSEAARQKVHDDGLEPEDLSVHLARFGELGLVTSGRVRAQWLLTDTPYCRATPDHHGLVADLLLVVATIARLSGARALITEDGIVEFYRDGRVLGACILASGRGHRGRPSVEALIGKQRRRHRARAVPITSAIVGATSDWGVLSTPPDDVVRGDVADDIVLGHGQLPLHHVAELRGDPSRVHQVVR
ncbi:hypothetical protein [Luteitalea sp.]